MLQHMTLVCIVYSLAQFLTCIQFSVSSHTGIGIGIGYWHWDRPILLGIGCPFWYRSNPTVHCCVCSAAKFLRQPFGRFIPPILPLSSLPLPLLGRRPLKSG